MHNQNAGGCAPSPRQRRVTRAERREIIFGLVVAGYSRELIAEKLCVSLKTVRREVEKAIDERRLDAPDRYVRLQVTRLTKALRVLDCALEEGDLKAVEPLLEVVGALDRYHALAAAGPAATEPRRLSRSAAPVAFAKVARLLAPSQAAACIARPRGHTGVAHVYRRLSGICWARSQFSNRNPRQHLDFIGAPKGNRTPVFAVREG